MLTVTWSVVLDTGSQLTALDLVTRVARRLDAHMEDVWLRPWGERQEQHEIHFRTSCDAGGDDLRSVLGVVLEAACRLSLTWAVDVSPNVSRSEDPLLQAWTPRDYRKFTVEGLAAASLSVRRMAPHVPARDVSSARQRAIAGGLVVNVVDREPPRDEVRST
jgi:hypothetical protein